MAIPIITIEATFPLLESQYKGARRSHVYFGTSSWSFPGWQRVFANEYKESQLAKAGLKAYAQHPLLNAVGLDRSFYAPLAINPHHLEANLAIDDFIGPASEGLGEKLGCLVFQFSPLPRSWLADAAKRIVAQSATHQTDLTS